MNTNAKILLISLPLTLTFACRDDDSKNVDDTDETVTDTDDTDDTDTQDTDTGDTGDSDTATEDGFAFARVVHLSADGPAVDVYANGAALGVNNITFPSGTGFLEVPAGDYTFEVAPEGAGYGAAVPVALDVNFEDGKSYTAIAHGYLDSSNGSNGFAITGFVDDTSAISDGFFRVNVIHTAAAEAFGQVDIWDLTDMSNPAPLIVDFDYGASVSTELPMGIAFVLGVDVNDDMVADAVFDIPDSLSGYVGLYAGNDVSGAPFLFAHFEDGMTARIDPRPQMSEVRVVHLSPDAPAVDVYANGAAVGVNNVAFPSGTGYLEVPSGDYTFEVAPAGTTYADAVPVALTATLEPGVSYTAIAHGYLDPTNGSNGFALTPFGNDRAPAAPGNFTVQVIHAAAAAPFAQVDIWNITDANNPTPLIENLDYGSEVTTELPMGIGFELGVDINNDSSPDATFSIPDSLSGFVAVYATNDTSGTPFLFAHLEDGTTVQINAN